MERKPKSFWETLPYRKQLFEAEKHRHETLAQWAARLNKLGEDAGYQDDNLIDKLLRIKFVTGLDPGPLQQFLKLKIGMYQLTYKQVLYIAFTTAAKFEVEAKAKACQHK